MESCINETSLPVCYGRVGSLEFGPFSLTELAELTSGHSLPEDLELRVDDQELWWSWPKIAAGITGSPSSSAFENWFTRIEDTINGPHTICDLTASILSGAVSTAVEIQIGDGPWRPLTDLLVSPDPVVSALAETVVLPLRVSPANDDQVSVRGPANHAIATTSNLTFVKTSVEQLEPPPFERPAGLPSSPAEIEQSHRMDAPVRVLLEHPTSSSAESKKHQLEDWLSKTMPNRPVTVVAVARTPVKPVEEIIAGAMVRVAKGADVAARELSYPWIWGSFAALVLSSVFFLWRESSGPDALELTALQRLKNTLEAVEAVRASKPNEAEWKFFRESLQEELADLKSQLERTKRGNKPVKETLFWAMEYRLPRMLSEGRLNPSSAETMFKTNIKEAERHLRPHTK